MVSVKVRGIYTTALTSLLLDAGFSIVQPSRETAYRFGLKYPDPRPCEILVQDKEDKQGVLIEGGRALEVVEALKDKLLDVVVRKRGEETKFEAEFPHAAKQALDKIRGKLVPTLNNHHKLKILAPEWVNLMESQLARTPERRYSIEEELERRLIFDWFQNEGQVDIEHVRPEGEVIHLRGRKMVGWKGKTMRLRRKKETSRPGKYDGLNMPIEEGDYSITEVEPCSWVVKHSYYSKQGRLKGEFYNVNTGAEFYPGKIRYIDLHVDVVKWADGRAEIIDRDKLETSVNEGYISERLAKKAIEVAEGMLFSLQAR